MINTRPLSEIRRECSRHPGRLATALRITKLAQSKLPAQTVYRRECSECSSKATKENERIKKL